MAIKLFVIFAVLVIVEADRTQDVRLKLCGREFIRMVVTSCGSSRLRHYAPDIDRSLGSPQSGNWWEGLGRSLFTQHTGIQHSEEGQRIDHASLESVTKNLPSSSHMGPPGKKTTRQAMSASARLQRDAGPAGVCCRLGCTMSELVQYC
ncbi:insulin-like 3 (Leydig cell) [Brachyhypopomus gauderio]|uniref:insulin-like 3 (Leydig cell) n=1 Tax=Brachyhypopomus gauderio TaxID=698409 RepID=UPI004041BB04